MDKKRFDKLVKKISKKIDRVLNGTDWATIDQLMRKGFTDNQIVQYFVDLENLFQSKEFKQSFWQGPMGTIMMEVILEN